MATRLHIGFYCGAIIAAFMGYLPPPVKVFVALQQNDAERQKSIILNG
jgi:hypothetical protein